MHMRFFCENIGTHCELSDEQAHHCIRVLRSKPGDTLELLNGNGEAAIGKIREISKTSVLVDIESIQQPYAENPNKLSIAICPTKNPSRLEWFIEKATEIGIDQIYLLLSARTEKASVKYDRLQHIIQSAALQSGQLYFPRLHPLHAYKEWLSTHAGTFDQRFIAHCEGVRRHLKDVYHPHKTGMLLIGPEGDFSADEVAMALNLNYIPVSLGNAILRVETAGVSACSIINSINFGE